MSTEISVILVTIIVIGTAWYLVKNDTKIWKFLYSKNSLGFLLILSVALSFYEGYSRDAGAELLFSTLSNAALLFLIFLIMGLPLLGVMLALLSVVFTKEYREGLSKDLDKTKEIFGEAGADSHQFDQRNITSSRTKKMNKEEITFSLNEAVSDNDTLAEIIERYEDKLLETGKIGQVIGMNGFDFSIHICDSEGKHYLAIDIFSDADDFEIHDVSFEDVFAVVIDGLEDREFFGEFADETGSFIDTEHLICLSGGEFIGKIKYV